MSMEKILSYDARDGMTLGELHAFIGELIAEGFDPDSEIKIRTFFKADRHGAKIKKITVVDKKAKKDKHDEDEPVVEDEAPVV